MSMRHPRKPISLAFRGIVRKPRRRPSRVQMKSDAWHLAFPLRASTPSPELMHEHSNFYYMHHFLPLPPDISPFICSVAANNWCRNIVFQRSCISFRFVPPARIKAGPAFRWKEMHGRPSPASVHLFPLFDFQKKRIDDERTFSPLSSSILIISLCLLL